MSEFDQMYREVILDHYKNPRGHGVMEGADAEAEGQNPLCGDEVSIYVAFGEDGDTIDEVKFSGRGCAISQAATSMLTEMVKGRKASEVAEMPKEELLEEIGIPLTPGAAEVRDARPDDAEGRAAQGQGHAAARWSRGLRRARAQIRVPELDVCPVEELPPGEVKIVHAGLISLGVYNLDGEYYAIEDRCSHDDGPLCEGEFDVGDRRRHLPAPRRELRHPQRPCADAPRLRAGEDVPVRVEDGMIKVQGRLLSDRLAACYVSSTAEGRWSVVKSSSTGSGGTSG